MNLRIDPEFKDYLGPLGEDARQELEAMLRAEGCRDALVVWPQPEGDPILLDGYNRHEICERLGIAYRTVNCPNSVTDRASAAAWMVRNQEGRRNITPDRLVYLRGKMYRAEQEAHGGDRKSGEARSSGQNVHLIEDGKTAQRIARAFGVNEKTIRRNAVFADRVDAVAAEHGQKAKNDVLDGRKKVSDYAPQPEPSLEEDAPPESKKPSVNPLSGETPATGQRREEKPETPDVLKMTHTQCIDWMAKNLPPNSDCGAVNKPIPMPESASENLADPEVAARGDNPFIFALCQMEYQATRAELELKLHPPPQETRHSLKKRLADLSSALETLSLALEELP
ncbi:MAG: hypothetical protein FWG74_02960 [Planctomycetes bacterium]|nr:hypothetical protein [Planctomycetota bacterium]